jgi:hypothetical protein
MATTLPPIAPLAAAYIRTKGTRLHPLERATFRRWLLTQYDRISPLVDFSADEISPDQLLTVWHSTGRLLISTAHNRHPVWLPEENARFRAIHDWHHIIGQYGFDFAGEVGTYMLATTTAPRGIWWILWSEIVLQAAATIHTGEFQRQKLVLV